mmetsp:Transcript_20361/g.42465  ORF Transcript_20361/g.42465 Transcript_20361/m.42465 type:complete len:235 (-) Transcript_20361:392-1096(-)
MGRRSGRSRRRGVVAAHRFSSSTTDGSYRDFQRRHERLVDVVRIGGILGRIVVGIGTDRSPWNRRDITVVFVAIEASVLRGDRGLLQLLLLMLLLMVLLMLLPGHCVVVDHHWTGTIRSHSIRKLVRLAWINCYVLPWRYGTYHGAHHSSLLLLLLLLLLLQLCHSHGRWLHVRYSVAVVITAIVIVVRQGHRFCGCSHHRSWGIVVACLVQETGACHDDDKRQSYCIVLYCIV